MVSDLSLSILLEDHSTCDSISSLLIYQKHFLKWHSCPPLGSTRKRKYINFSLKPSPTSFLVILIDSNGLEGHRKINKIGYFEKSIEKQQSEKWSSIPHFLSISLNQIWSVNSIVEMDNFFLLLLILWTQRQNWLNFECYNKKKSIS